MPDIEITHGDRKITIDYEGPWLYRIKDTHKAIGNKVDGRIWRLDKKQVIQLFTELL